MDGIDANESWHDCDCDIAGAPNYPMLIRTNRNPDIPACIETFAWLWRLSLRWGT